MFHDELEYALDLLLVDLQVGGEIDYLIGDLLGNRAFSRTVSKCCRFAAMWMKGCVEPVTELDSLCARPRQKRVPIAHE